MAGIAHPNLKLCLLSLPDASVHSHVYGFRETTSEVQNLAEQLRRHYGCSEDQLTAKFLDNIREGRAVLRGWCRDCRFMPWYERSAVRVSYLGVTAKTMRTKKAPCGKPLLRRFNEDGFYLKYPDLPLIGVTVLVKGTPTGFAVPMEMLY